MDAKKWRNEGSWTQWDNRTIEGQLYSFSHLLPFDMQISRPAIRNMQALLVSIRVVFDCHVTTEKNLAVSAEDVQGLQSYWVDSGGVCRLFHPDRYQRSLGLPSLIKGLPDGKTKCYVAAYENYMVWKPDEAADGPHYQVFFDLYRTADPTPRLVLYVQSAYLKDAPKAAQREKEKPFAAVCAELAGFAVVKEAKLKTPKMRKQEKKEKLRLNKEAKEAKKRDAK
jgi:hypothetical protein